MATPLSLLTSIPTFPASAPAAVCLSIGHLSRLLLLVLLLLLLLLLLILLWPWSNRIRELKLRHRCRSNPPSLFIHIVTDPRTCPCLSSPSSCFSHVSLSLSLLRLLVPFSAALCCNSRLAPTPAAALEHFDWQRHRFTLALDYLPMCVCVCVRASSASVRRTCQKTRCSLHLAELVTFF